MVIFSTFFCQTAFADNSDGETVTGGMKSMTQEDIDECWNSLSEAEFARVQEKLATVEEELQRPMTRAASDTWTSLYGGVTLFKQEQSNFCGPACTKTVVHYINGYSDSQAGIAISVGTTSTGTVLSNMVRYINGQQSKNTYVLKNDNNSTTLGNNLYAGIATYGTPPIVCINSQGKTWRYQTNGHAIVIASTRNDKKAFVVADPWIGYADDHNIYYEGKGEEGEYYVRSLSEIYNVYSPAKGYAF